MEPRLHPAQLVLRKQDVFHIKFMIHRLFRLASSTRQYRPQELELMCSMIKYKRFKINEEIDVAEKVKVLDQKNRFLGMFNVSAALSKAHAQKLDLVLISVLSDPKICKIVRYLDEVEVKFYE